MTRVDEQQLSRSLRRAGEQVSASADLAERVVARGAAVRQRRVRAAAVVTASTAAVLAVVTVQSREPATDGGPAVGPSVVQTMPSASPDPTSTATVTDDFVEDVTEWLASLPVGVALAIPYTTATELVDGTTRVPLPGPLEAGEFFSIAGRAGDAAWVVVRSTMSGDGSATSTVGRLDETGAFTELHVSPVAVHVGVSPVGTMLAVTSAGFRPGDPVHVLDWASAATVTTLPLIDNEELIGWSASGLVVVDHLEGQTRLVQLDGSSAPLPAARVALVDEVTDLAVLGNAAGCAKLVYLHAPEEPIHEFCDGTGRLSPDGRWRVGLDPPGEHQWRIDAVLDLEPGAQTSLPLPSPLDSLSVAGWEDAEHVIFTASIWPSDHPNEMAVVRCSVRELRCELALPIASGELTSPYHLMGSPGW